MIAPRLIPSCKYGRECAYMWGGGYFCLLIILLPSLPERLGTLEAEAEEE